MWRHFNPISFNIFLKGQLAVRWKLTKYLTYITPLLSYHSNFCLNYSDKYQFSWKTKIFHEYTSFTLGAILFVIRNEFFVQDGNVSKQDKLNNKELVRLFKNSYQWITDPNFVGAFNFSPFIEATLFVAVCVAGRNNFDSLMTQCGWIPGSGGRVHKWDYINI